MHTTPLRLTPNSQQYCGITPYYGSDTYLYQRLPMGLKVSPAIWQAFINKVLGPIPNRQRHIAIMDDCLVHSKFADHMQDLTNFVSIPYGSWIENISKEMSVL